MAPTRDRHAQMPALVRAFQTDPAWMSNIGIAIVRRPLLPGPWAVR